MKKILSIMLVAALAMPMFAEKQGIEERANADYSSWLPQAGEFSLGFSVDPFANFLGQMFSVGATPNEYTRGEYNIGGQGLGYNKNSALRLTSPVVSIMGSYMLTDNLGVKANIGLIVDHERRIYNVEDQAVNFEQPLKHGIVNDVWIHGEYGGSFSAGVEYRLGKRRVQGVFGAGLMYAFQTSANKYSYGNQMTEANQMPTVAGALWDGKEGVYKVNPEEGVYAATRLVNDAGTLIGEGEHGGQEAFWHRFGLYTSVGVEWFVAPKIALGLNVNLDLLYKWSSNVCMQYEGYNLLTKQTEVFTDVRNVANYSGVTFGTENIGANLYLAFYFGK
jgi:opacity protein-like surface antigen